MITRPFAVALLVRALVVLVSARELADVERYRKLAVHLLDVSWNPYQARRLYPYPPVWMWFEAAAEWLARHAAIPFAVSIKVPVLAADLGILVLLVRLLRDDPAQARRAAWAWALHPVALLVSGFHGQFDALALLALLGALLLLRNGRADASALALAAAIGVKSFPVVLVPVLALERPSAGARVRYAALATVPVALALVPFVLHDAAAVVRELFGYGGVADFGWIGAWRGGRWLLTGRVIRGEAAHWPAAVAVSKALFLAALSALVALRARGLLHGPPHAVALLVLLAFLGLYGALSAQYLLWVIPLALLAPSRWHRAYAWTATVALVGFYLFLAPGVLLDGSRPGPPFAGVLWTLGAAATLAVVIGWALHAGRGLLRQSGG